MVLITVIVPFYNGTKYLPRLIKMLNKNREMLKNKFDNIYDMNVIIVNDSPDIKINTSLYTIKFPIMIVYNKINAGIHASRLQGLKKSNGDYIVFLDQDDYITDNYIEDQITKIKNNDFIVANGYLQNQDGSKEVLYKTHKHHNCCIDLKCFYCLTNPISSPGLVLIKKDAIPDEWKQNVFKTNGADDAYLWMLMLENKKKAIINNSILFTHVITGNNTSLNNSDMYDSGIELVQKLTSVSYMKRSLIKRRIKYSQEKEKTFLAKIKYIDICSLKFLYRYFYIN